MRTNRVSIPKTVKVVPSFLFVLLMAALPAAAQSFSVIHIFTGAKADGAGPHAGLTADSAGNLYGTTTYGGLEDYGTVFELPIAGAEKVLHNFTSNWDGAYPAAGLTLDANGDLYGTAKVGGNPSCGDIGCGLVFKVAPGGKETAPHIFKGQGDGGFPVGGLIRDGLGNLYGTAGGDGTFTGACATYGCGVIFKIDPAGHESVLHSFNGAPDGNGPVTQLVRDANGNLYGATAWGGNTGCINGGGCGVIFKLDPAGNETVLYTFTGGADGGTPGAGVLAIDASGNLYGTAQYGGDLSCPLSQPWAMGCGVIFKLDPTGNQTILYTFSGAADGGQPNGGIIRDSKGNLYGTAGGGTPSGACTAACGVVFKLSPAGTLTVLHNFSGTDGEGPAGTLLFQKGYLYGTTVSDTRFYGGVVFKVRP